MTKIFKLVDKKNLIGIPPTTNTGNSLAITLCRFLGEETIETVLCVFRLQSHVNLKVCGIQYRY